MNEAKYRADEIVTQLSSGLKNMDALIDAIESNLKPLAKADVIPRPAKVNIDRALQLIEIAYVVLDTAEAADEQWQKVFEAL